MLVETSKKLVESDRNGIRSGNWQALVETGKKLVELDRKSIKSENW